MYLECFRVLGVFVVLGFGGICSFWGVVGVVRV